MNKLVLSLLLLLGATAHALPCSSIYDIKAASVGTKCTSTTGQVFEKVERTGFSEAWDACADRGAYLPLVSEGRALDSQDPLPHARSYEFWTVDVLGEGVKTIEGQPIGGAFLDSRSPNTICVVD